VENYGRNAATLALHFGASPEHLAPEEINAYLYRLATNETFGESYFKFTVYGMRYWFRLFTFFPPSLLNVTMCLVQV